MTIPRATVRLQFHEAFTLNDAIPLVDYFADLGISHVYASPLTVARAGSNHGYDTIDYSQISPVLGGEDALRRLVQKLRAADMGLILDIVPNHMASSSTNAWWWDVLEWGKNSRYANFFDIDWDSSDPRLKGKVLTPFLGDAYGTELKEGHIQLHFNEERGAFEISYFDNRFPLTPLSYTNIFSAAPRSARLVALIRVFGALEEASEVHHREAASQVLREAASVAETRADIQTAIQAHDARYPQGRERLHRLLERQHYRLTWWRNAAEEMNWRRFFEISDLVGLRVEQQPVFDAAHELVLRLYGEGLIDGVRIDHVDGLTDPQKYCLNLRASLGSLTSRRPASLQSPPYIVVEKILGPGENLDSQWRVEGTTGYDFMNEVGAVLHDERGEDEFTRLWETVSGEHRSFHDIVLDARRMLLARHFAGELENLSRSVYRIGQLELETRDWSLPAIRRVMTELLVAFPVYRTYATVSGRTEQDEHFFSKARSQAAACLQADDRKLLDVIADWLGGTAPYTLEPGEKRDARMEAIRRFQQLTAPLAAKSVEDTGFFRYGRLLSRNEVGAEPSLFAIDARTFHDLSLHRSRHFPHAMLATATHDHKRGEDARMRLAVLSEIPTTWASMAGNWLDRSDGAPHPVDQYMLFQTLVAAWPAELSPQDHDGIAQLRERVSAWQIKSLREGKLRSSWFSPDEQYEERCTAFLASRLDDAGFLADLSAFVEQIGPAAALKSLSQCVLRMTAPGVPDLYQGTEFWDFSLTDPDNRRPVDFEARLKALETPASPQELVQNWRTGHVKQAVVRHVLQYRKDHADLFATGTYQPLSVSGPGERHVVAYARQMQDRCVLVIVPRLFGGLPDASGSEPLAMPLIPAADWGNTAITLPDALAGRTLHSVFDGKVIDALSNTLALREVLSVFPVAMLYAV